MKNRKKCIQASVLFLTIFGAQYCATDIAYAATSTVSENLPYQFISFFPSSTLHESQKAGEMLLTVFGFAKKIIKIVKEVISRVSMYAISGFHRAGDLFLSLTGISFSDFMKGLWSWLLWLLNWTVGFLKAIFSR